MTEIQPPPYPPPPPAAPPYAVPAAPPKRGRGKTILLTVLGLLLALWAVRLVAGGQDETTGTTPDAEREDVVAAVGPACRGRGASDAGRHSGNERFHAVIVNDRGRPMHWSGRNAPWRADTIADTELVACESSRSELIQTCEYNGPDIRRFRTIMTVRVVSARNATPVDSFTVTADPRMCAYSESYDLTRLDGEVTFAQVSRRVGEIARRPA